MKRTARIGVMPLLGLLIGLLVFPDAVWSQRGGRGGGRGGSGGSRGGGGGRTSSGRSMPANYGSVRSSSSYNRGAARTGVSSVTRQNPTAGNRLEGVTRDGGIRETPRGGLITGGTTPGGGAWVAGETAGGRDYVHGRTGDGDRFTVGRGTDGNIYARAKGDFNGAIVDLPGDSVAVIVGGCTYYRHGYDYYWPYYYGGSVYYQEVYAPTGTVYTTLPTDTGTIQIGEQVYYTYDGVYYQKVGDQYVVVDAPSRPSEAPAPIAGGDAGAILKRMDGKVAELKQFVMDYSETVTTSKDADPEVHQRRIYVRRPDRLAARDMAGEDLRQYVYDGKTVTVFDPGQKVYGAVEAPATLAETIEFLREKYGLPVPLGDLLNGDFAGAIQAEWATLQAEGQESSGGRNCVKLVFQTQEVRGTIWVDADETVALPRRMQLVYVSHPDQPKYEILIQRWDSAAVDDKLFTFSPPDDATRINLVPRGSPGAAP